MHAGDVFHKVMRNGMKFMTSDRRTGKIYSPWWYGTTTGELGANLNGIYNDELGTFLNMYWVFTEEEPALSRIEIKMRPETFINCLPTLPPTTVKTKKKKKKKKKITTIR